LSSPDTIFTTPLRRPSTYASRNGELAASAMRSGGRGGYQASTSPSERDNPSETLGLSPMSSR
jgi:hypothetical protein